MIEVSPAELKIILTILQHQVPDRTVWAFGSRARGNAKQFSDLDLAIIGTEPLSLHTMAALSDDFDNSNLPYKVDLVDWATISETFREVIRRDKVVLCE